MKKTLIIGGGLLVLVAGYFIYRKIQKDNLSSEMESKIATDPNLDLEKKTVLIKQQKGETLTPRQLVVAAQLDHQGRG